MTLLTNTNPEYYELLARCISWAPSADNTQPFSVRFDSEKLTLYYDEKRVAGTTFPASAHASLLAAGCAKENLRQLLNASDMKATFKDILAIDHLDDQFHVLTMDLPEKLDSTLSQHALFNRHTNRLPYHTQPLTRQQKGYLESLSTDNVNVIVMEASDKAVVADWIHHASCIRFQTKEVHEFLAKSLRFTQAEVLAGDGLDIATLPLPPFGGALMRYISKWENMSKLNKVGLYKLFATIEAKSILASGNILAITNKHGMSNIVKAGEIMEKAWIWLNQENLAVQPYYVVADQIKRLTEGKISTNLVKQASLLSNEVTKKLELGDTQQLSMLMRIGTPRKAALRSQRLPIRYITQQS